MLRRLLVALLLPFALVACSPSVPADDDTAEDDDAMMQEDADAAMQEEARVETDDGMMQVGGGLPDSWPSDIPVYAGATVLFSGMSEGKDGAQGTGLMYSTNASARVIVDFYKERLTAAGWTVQNVVVSTIASGLEAVKDGQHLGLGIATQNGETVVTLGIEAAQ